MSCSDILSNEHLLGSLSKELNQYAYICMDMSSGRSQKISVVRIRLKCSSVITLPELDITQKDCVI